MNRNQCTIAFTGDIGFDRYMADKWKDENLLSKSVLDFLRASDHVAANVEGALLDAEDDGSRGTFFHCMNPEASGILEKIHSDIWSIGNNHTMDAGFAGLRSTKNIAAEMGCQTIGAGRNEEEASSPVYLEEAGGIGIFTVAYMSECIPATETEPGVFRWDDMEYIARRIREIKARCRWCVIISHGGEEFADMPNPYTRARYLEYLKLGADVVVGHHPHVVENYETFDNGKAIFYSLGNFIFDTDYQRAHPYTDTGVLLKLVFHPDRLDFEAIGIRILRGEEQIDSAPLPDIFTDIPAYEYELLAPLAAAAFIKEERKKMIYLERSRFENASEEIWNQYFFSTEPDGYSEGSHMDLAVIYPFSQTMSDDAWRQSRLDKVKNYLLRHFS